jgi:hypothetical protein
VSYAIAMAGDIGDSTRLTQREFLLFGLRRVMSKNDMTLRLFYICYLIDSSD